MFLANMVRPEGHVYTMEMREEFAEVAQRNLRKSGLLTYVTLTHGNAEQGFAITDADLAVLDVGDPWILVGAAWSALRGSGILVSISPTINQVEKTVQELSVKGFVDIECIEVLVREMQVRTGMTRPTMRMVGHTAYLTFARKVKGVPSIVAEEIRDKMTEGQP
jgi:tRNA (adenine57-N1/adenine58-N1)-methyltransferase